MVRLGNIASLIACAAVSAMVCVPQPASAISVELAKKCRELALKAHPTQRAGTKTGAAKAQQEYFRACVAKQGKM